MQVSIKAYMHGINPSRLSSGMLLVLRPHLPWAMDVLSFTCPCHSPPTGLETVGMCVSQVFTWVQYRASKTSCTERTRRWSSEMRWKVHLLLDFYIGCYLQVLALYS